MRFPHPIGRRPAVLVSRNQAYRVRAAVTVVPLTQTVRGIPVEAFLGPADDVPRRSVANAHTIATVPKDTLVEYVAPLAHAKLEALETAINFALDLP